ncbi:hypothetical protein Dimus_016601, partial [Dionaea muscipula]
FWDDELVVTEYAEDIYKFYKLTEGKVSSELHGQATDIDERTRSILFSMKAIDNYKGPPHEASEPVRASKLCRHHHPPPTTFILHLRRPPATKGSFGVRRRRPPQFMPLPYIPSSAYDVTTKDENFRLPCESSHSSSKVLFTPQVKDELVPKINQELDSLDDVYKFYNTYAKESGFGTTSSSSRKNREDVIMRKEFYCSKEGVGRNNDVIFITTSWVSRHGCSAKIAVVKKGEKYVVT